MKKTLKVHPSNTGFHSCDCRVTKGIVDIPSSCDCGVALWQPGMQAAWQSSSPASWQAALQQNKPQGAGTMDSLAVHKHYNVTNKEMPI